MSTFRPANAARVLLALGCWLAVLTPGATGQPAAAPAPPAALAAAPPAGAGQGLVRDRPGGSPIAPGTRRDDRQRPGLDLPGLLAAALATTLAATAATGRPRGRPGRRRPRTAAGPRGPPTLLPAPI
jgi:hypothetical protein